MNKIEHSCRTILNELKRGHFNRNELTMLEALFITMAESTKKLPANIKDKEGGSK